MEKFDEQAKSMISARYRAFCGEALNDYENGWLSVIGYIDKCVQMIKFEHETFAEFEDFDATFFNDLLKEQLFGEKQG